MTKAKVAALEGPRMSSADAQAALQEVTRALGETRPFDALAALHAAWRSTRSTVQRDLLLQLGERLALAVPATPGGSNKEFTLAWVNAARLAVAPRADGAPDRVALAALVRDLLPKTERWNSASLLPCLDALAEVQDEPCLAPLGAALLGLRSGVVGMGGPSVKIYRRALDLLQRSGDVPTAREACTRFRVLLDETEQRRATFRGPVAAGGTAPKPLSAVVTLQAITAKRLAQLDLVETSEPAAADWKRLGTLIARVEPVALPAMVAKVSASGHTEAELLARVAANPDDEETLSVLADVWQQAGDPRGEFLALQLSSARGTSTAAQLAREAKLLEKHRKVWLGALSGVVVLGSVEFERGTLRACTLAPKKQSQFEVVKDDPLWGTVRRLNSVRADWITAALRSLESLTVGGFNFFSTVRMRALPPSLRQLTVCEWFDDFQQAHLDHLIAAAPNLTSFSCLAGRQHVKEGTQLAVQRRFGARVLRRTTAPVEPALLGLKPQDYSASWLVTLHLGEAQT